MACVERASFPSHATVKQRARKPLHVPQTTLAIADPRPSDSVRPITNNALGPGSR
jgi:hypothetical protein